MMWLLAGVVVVVLGCSAVIGTGRWGAMPDLVDDRPARLPAEGLISGDDVRDTRFSVVTRGYSMTQVDELLERLAGQLDGSEQHPQQAPGGASAARSEAPDGVAPSA